MPDPNDFLKGFEEAYKHTSKYKDSVMMEIVLRRKEFEQRLDDMWRIYKSGNMKQVFAYQEQVRDIKQAGLVVLRSKSTGKHKIVFPDGRKGP